MKDSPDSAQCPSCGARGRAVPATTIEHLVVPVPSTTPGWRFCPARGCVSAYFRGSEVLGVGRVRVPIFQKLDDPARLVCYCFSHTAADIQASGKAIVASITLACRGGQDRCDELNPQGRCCLANVRALANHADADADDSDCCC